MESSGRRRFLPTATYFTAYRRRGRDGVRSVRPGTSTSMIHVCRRTAVAGGHGRMPRFSILSFFIRRRPVVSDERRQ
jgi:hypothetical protein